MKWLGTLTLALSVVNASPVVTVKRQSGPQGIDVSSHQGTVDWGTVAANGIQFAYIKATEGTYYTNPDFSSQYTGATNAGLIRGSYHFARPDTTTGATQAQFFLSNGGGWSPDGITLPGAIDIEYNPYGAECYGVSAAGIVSWVSDFSNTYFSSTGRYPVVYTTTDWWTTCTGNDPGISSINPLWIARYSSNIGALPAGYSSATFWQYASSGPNPGDADVFIGDSAGLSSFAA